VTLISVDVPITLFLYMIPYSSVQVFKYFQLKLLPFLDSALVRINYGYQKCDIFNININVSTSYAYAYCYLNYHRFHPLNSRLMTNVQKRKEMILLITFFS